MSTLKQKQIHDVELGTGSFQRRKIDHKKFIKRSALDSDYELFIDHDFILRENGKPIIVYLHVPDLPSIALLNVLKSIEWGRSARTAGLRNQESKIFGYMPRETIRKDYCSSTALAYEDPEGHKVITDFGSILSELYEKYCPDMFTFHNEATKSKIKDEWIIKKTPFTSGIVNKNNPLKYHFDSGNIKSVFSNMVCFKNECEGGYLSIPEFNLGLEIADKTVLFFDGQSIMHGVTPFRINSVKGYRYTMVYYTLNQMWHCDTIDQELARIKNVKTERETLRYKRLIGAEMTEAEKIKNNGLKKTHGFT